MTTVTLVVPVGRSLTNKELLSNQLWRQLVARVMADFEFQALLSLQATSAQRQWAERIMEQAVGFLRLCAEQPEGRYAPSTLVDIGWHTFILHTREYAKFCETLAGHFIHHAPTGDASDKDTSTIARTIAAMRARGITVDEALWPSAAECQGSKCYSCVDGGCRG